MRCHRLAGPHRTRFARRVVTNRENKIERWCAGLCKFAPGFRTKAGRVISQPLQKLECVLVDLALRLTAGAVRLEFSLAELVQDCLGHDRARRIAGTEEKRVEWLFGHG